MNTWIWQQVRVELPDEWEMLRYSRNPETGHCGFADRYQIRFELHWRRVPGPPDRERMLADTMSRLQDRGVANVERTHTGDWDGLVGTEDGKTVSRFGRYFAAEGFLLELVFLWPDGRDANAEQDLLARVAAEPARDGMRRWRAFGLDMCVPEGFELAECRQHAARAEFVFRAPRGVGELRFVRLGMAPVWLQDPVETWLRTQVPAGVRIDEASTRQTDGHAVAYLAGRAKRWCRGVRLHRPECEFWATICPADGRVYMVARRDTSRRRGVDLP